MIKERPRSFHRHNGIMQRRLSQFDDGGAARDAREARSARRAARLTQASQAGETLTPGFFAFHLRDEHGRMSLHLRPDGLSVHRTRCDANGVEEPTEHHLVHPDREQWAAFLARVRAAGASHWDMPDATPSQQADVSWRMGLRADDTRVDAAGEGWAPVRMDDVRAAVDDLIGL